MSDDERPDLDETRVPGESDDPRLVAAVLEYRAALEAGRRPNRQEFLRRYADIAGELSMCLQGLEFLNSAVGQMDGGRAGTQREAEFQDSVRAKPLGDFKLLREIGRGGMGVVYEAIQLSLGRRVAVKVLPLASALDSRHLQRFRNEAQAAAQLHHSNIVPVYAVGNERGVHFYAMQLIEGQSLADVIRLLRIAGGKDDPLIDDVATATQHTEPASDLFKLRAAATAQTPQPNSSNAGATLKVSDPLENLTTMRESKRTNYFRFVSNLIVQAAEALDYAHRFGIVHRDIKPANLMLDARGTLWVTDFGLAQMYVESGLTQPGDMLGTLRYMSPEQASGEAVVLDQRTDIYSLGVVLYEMLTLERALPGKTREELLSQLGIAEPVSLRAVDPTIPIELDTIVMKAIAKDPRERYATASEFAEDLQRFLNDEPILARPPTLWDKTIKWTRRHRSLALSGVAMLVVIAIGLLISTILIAHEEKKTKSALAQTTQAEWAARLESQRANASLQNARDAVDFFTDVAANDIPKNFEFLSLRKELLEKALDFNQNFLEQRQDEPGMKSQIDSARQRVAMLLSEVSNVMAQDRMMLLVSLASNRTVQEELGLTSDQAQKIAEFAQSFPGKPKTPTTNDIFALQPSERAKMAAQTTQEGQAALDKILSPKQSQRLKELARQARGVKAFEDADVVETLALTPEQQDAIRAISIKNVRGGPPRGENNGKADQMKEALTLLTPEQCKRWSESIGSKFAIPHDTMGPGFGHGHGPGDHGHGPDDHGPSGPPPD